LRTRWVTPGPTSCCSTGWVPTGPPSTANCALPGVGSRQSSPIEVPWSASRTSTRPLPQRGSRPRARRGAAPAVVQGFVRAARRHHPALCIADAIQFGGGIRVGPVVPAPPNIEPYEVMQALLDERPRWPQTMRSPQGLLVHTVWCRTRSGRSIIVVLAHAEKRFDWIIRGVRHRDDQEGATSPAWEATRG